MGVQGLWRLLDATGKQVPLETLEGKILAVDVSIWIHQVLQGYQDRFGNSKPNAHLIGLFNRICKLLYYKIKPVFVFDGGVPMLKKDTIALRRNMKSMAKNKAQQMRTELINNLIKHSAVRTVLNTEEENVGKISSEIVTNVQTKQTADDMFKLPDLPSTSKVESDHSDDYDSDSSVNLSPRKQTKWIGNIHNVDVTSADFKALPADVRYDILTDLKETRKQNSWGRLHEMPEETHEFSGFQMKRLLKRRLVQQNLETAEKEMGGKTLTLDELDKLLTEQGVNTSGYNCTYRVAADNSTRLLYISDKNAYIKSTSNNDNSQSENTKNNVDKVEEPVPGSSKAVPICEDINEYEFDNEWDSDIEITATNNSKLTVEEMSSDAESDVELNESRRLTKKYLGKNVVNPALTYMLEYSGLTEKQILTLLEQNKKKEGYEGTQNASKESQQTEFANLDFTESTQSFNTLQTELSESNTESNIRSQTELSESNTELDSNASSFKASNASNTEQIKSIDTAIISSTDSDSDDFVEIQDVLIPDVDTDGNNSASKEGIQITFRSDQKIEDDIFADVFETPNSKSDAEIKSQNSSLTSEISEKLVESFSESRETSEDKVIPQKAIVESTEDKIKDQQLPDSIKMDDTEKQPVENDENRDTQLQTDQTKLTNKENITNHETNNAEITSIQNSTIVDVPSDDSRRISPLPVNEDELLSLKTRLEAEQSELAANIGKFDRQGINISNQIRIESQELLRLFGIPYIVAPMEAEAQCAYLEQIHLTDGTITDDSDIWLFGGQCVYKNFFDNDKKVLQYCSNDIHHHFKLTRSEMIRLALLVGSDYTTGLPGIGPVTALEILAAFPSEGDDVLRGLTTFCSWIKSGRAVGPGKAALRNKLQNVQIHKGFPSQAVVQAYLFPEVDESKECFTWGKLNTLLLSDYTRQKFGWTKEKFDKIITPILNRMEEKQSQKTINAYFKVHTVPKSIEVNMSKRVQKAVQKLSNPNAEEAPESMLSKLQQMKRTKSKPQNENRKKKTKLTDKEDAVEAAKPNTLNVPATSDKYVEEYIPQREKDREAALKKRLNAIEVLRKSKQGLYKTKKVKRCVRKVKKEAGLSESDSSSS
ncbi:DNA excision repair protein ERCC-5 homolog [Hylaeus volcanicus]|uniref:DNA excision repair protein ERCC-5 homolog n=1 Tax=Hylaeus volcanicus TaxID=313075 RepID=UPI0023B87AF7|nr:DNA excision repair protein ERCC-5 homolog [Hylaeus volcanicus]